MLKRIINLIIRVISISATELLLAHAFVPVVYRDDAWSRYTILVV
jgi:hypothetical protein